jgi:hypothetical protein
MEALEVARERQHQRHFHQFGGLELTLMDFRKSLPVAG